MTPMLRISRDARELLLRPNRLPSLSHSRVALVYSSWIDVSTMIHVVLEDIGDAVKGQILAEEARQQITPPRGRTLDYDPLINSLTCGRSTSTSIIC